MKIINFKDTYIKSNKDAFEYETQNKYISYYEMMLIANDEDKLNTQKIQSPDNILKKNALQKKIKDINHILII